jgi:peptidoglycan lytic transglycosylase G
MVARRTARVMAVVMLLLAAALVWFLIELFQPLHGSGHGSVTVTIPAHSSSSQVGDLLEHDGVIASSFFFELRATLGGQRGKLRSGTYHLKLDMSYGGVLKVLTTPPPPVPVTELTLIEGKSRHQIDALLRSQGIHGSYIAATRHSPLLNPARYGAPRNVPSLEGFLFPATYQLREPVRIADLVSDQLRAFKQQFATVKLGYARRHRLSPYDVLTIASIIEDEAAVEHDYPLVASVIYNRLKDHMPLGMDSTTRYEFNDWTHPLTSSQLAAPSPYNTRANVGLPPTPIGNPGITALEAAAHPAQTKYLYFVAGVCRNGASVFTSSYAQFLVFRAQYQTARARRGGSPVHC